MIKKILVVSLHKEDFEQLEEILSLFLQKGGELLFSSVRDEALGVLKEEKPECVFLDNQLVGNCDDWVFEDAHVILMREVSDNLQYGEEFVDRPLRKEVVLEKCRSILKSQSCEPLPPM